MTAIVLDASVAVKLVSEEPGSDLTLDRVTAASDIIAPDWIIIETLHALQKKKAGASPDALATAQAAMDAIRQIIDRTVPSSTLLPVALELSYRLPHPIYDCLYLALAQAENAVVLTADQRFVRAAGQAGLGGSVEMLEAV